MMLLVSLQTSDFRLHTFFLFSSLKSNFLFNFAAELLNWLARIRAASFHDALRVWRVCPARHFYIL